jgi:CRP-like cAMP-binding protein
MQYISCPKQNHFLASLPEDTYQRLLPDLELVSMPIGRILHESGSRLSHIFFPTTSIVSLLHVMESGGSAEIAIVGRDGLVGVSVFMGSDTALSRALVLSSGDGYRVKSNIIKREFANGGELQALALRYTQALITQMAQTALCNRHHALEQQLCRWLLCSLDRLPGNELLITQEMIANMLGVRREGVTEAAGKLQSEGMIRYSRGHITILDRKKLESRVCECYAVVVKEYDRLLSFKACV